MGYSSTKMELSSIMYGLWWTWSKMVMQWKRRQGTMIWGSGVEIERERKKEEAGERVIILACLVDTLGPISVIIVSEGNVLLFFKFTHNAWYSLRVSTSPIILVLLLWLQEGATPLYFASQEGFTAIVRVLIDGGATVDFPVQVCIMIWWGHSSVIHCFSARCEWMWVLGWSVCQ